MNAEFTYAPLSGEFTEIKFDIDTAWKSADWSWVKFSVTNEDWYGEFRGTAKEIATAFELGLVAILTYDCLYIVNPFSRKILFTDIQTTIQQLETDSTGSKFIIADWTCIRYIDSDLIIKDAPTDIDCDNIKFLGVKDNKLELEFEEIPDYSIKKGLLNLTSWELEMIE